MLVQCNGQHNRLMSDYPEFNSQYEHSFNFDFIQQFINNALKLFLKSAKQKTRILEWSVKYFG